MPELDRNRAAVGVDDDFALLEIGDACRRGKMDRQHGIEKRLKQSQAFCLIGEPGKAVAAGEMVCQ